MLVWRERQAKKSCFFWNYRSFRIVDVRDKVALVTGAGARIGRAMALSLARTRGMRVAVHCRDSMQGAEGVAAEIRSIGGDARVFQADLSRRAEAEGLVSRVAGSFGDVVSVLVNNASVFERDEWDSVSEDMWARHMSVNLEAAYVLSRCLAEGIREGSESAEKSAKKSGGEAGGVVKGVIVNMLDQRVLRLTPHYVSYSVSKFGLFGLTQILAMAMAPKVRVVGLGLGQVLGQVLAEEGKKGGEGEEEMFLRRVRSTLIGEVVGLEDVCGVLGMVLENDSLTGQTIAVDGGQHLGGR